jgi:hypothetical protein
MDVIACPAGWSLFVLRLGLWGGTNRARIASSPFCHFAEKKHLIRNLPQHARL